MEIFCLYVHDLCLTIKKILQYSLTVYANGRYKIPITISTGTQIKKKKPINDKKLKKHLNKEI